jgi:hypothetical protein
LEDLIHTAVEYTVMTMVGIIGWIGKTLHGKANKSEVEKLEDELQRLREKVFSLFEKLATKEDLNKLEAKLDKLIDREIDRGRNRK